MTEPVDERPRRRLFGRRRVEPDAGVAHHDDTPSVADDNPAPVGGTGVEVGEPAPAPPTPRVPAPAPPIVPEAVEPARPETATRSEPEPEPLRPAPDREPEPQPEPEQQPKREYEGAMAAASTEAPTTGAPTTEAPTTVEPASAEPAPEPDAASADGGPGPLPLPRVIAIANQKGGVGKTTTAVNLGAALAEGGFRVLVVDLDPQGNASTGLGINPRDVESSVYDVIMAEAPVLDSVEPTTLKNLFVLPAKIDLAGADIELVATFSRELKLRRALDPVREEYDIILIDCPPSLGLLTVNGLAAADDVIVPVQSEYYALEGLGQLLKNVAMVRSVNPTLDVRGIVLTMHDSRTKLAEQVELEVREHFGARVYKTVVPRTIRIAEAPSFGQPIIVFDPTSRGAKAYRELAKEVSGGATRRSG
jgi:chromosome partitioning protein